MRIPGLAVLIAALAAGTAESATRTEHLTGVFAAAPTEAEVEAQIIEGANAFRVQNRLRPLAVNEILAGEARAFAAYLARTGAFSHTADGREPAERARAAGYAYCDLAENIERIDGHAPGARLGDQFMDGWEQSPGHRRNLLDSAATEVGVGVARAAGGYAYVAVQVFGRPLSDRYVFRIANRARGVVGYTLDGRPERLEPSTTITYTVCTPSTLTFDDVDPDDGPVLARPGALYVLGPGLAGRIRLMVVPDTAGGARRRAG